MNFLGPSLFFQYGEWTILFPPCFSNRRLLLRPRLRDRETTFSVCPSCLRLRSTRGPQKKGSSIGKRVHVWIVFAGTFPSSPLLLFPSQEVPFLPWKSNNIFSSFSLFLEDLFQAFRILRLPMRGKIFFPEKMRSILCEILCILDYSSSFRGLSRFGSLAFSSVLCPCVGLGEEEGGR